MFNSIIVKFLPYIPKPIVFSVAKRYIAGQTLDEAIFESKKQNQLKRLVTIDVLGEHIKDLNEADLASNEYSEVLERMFNEKIHGNISVKPTQMGLGINKEHALAIYQKLLDSANQKSSFIRIDMEDSPYTDLTIELYETLRTAGYTNVGIVLQAYLRRNLDDIQRLSKWMSHTQANGGKHIRLCKGIYIEPEAIAFKGKEEVRENFKKSLDLLFELDISVGIATHDDILIEYAMDQIKKRSLPVEKYEFQMLLGVLPPLGDKIVARGHPLRIYVPFGEKWYAYSIRRLKENPAMAGYIVRATLGLQ